MKALWILLIVAIVLTGCAPGSQPAKAEVAASQVPRETTPDIAEGDLQTLVEGNTAFAVDLYRQLRTSDGNLFFSPHSISTALAMTYAGAEGKTAEQMAETLHFNLSGEQLHAAFNALDLTLTPGEDVGEEDFVLNIANSLWAEETYDFHEEFLDLLARHYGAGLRLVDFKTAYEAARQAINAWVEDATEGKIEDLIPEGGVNDLTRLVLANAIYFNAKWVHPFSQDLTEDGAFTRLDESEVTVPMMRWDKPTRVPYTRGDGFQAIELPYRGGNAGMVIVVPDAGAFETFEEELTGKQLQAIVDALETRSVELTLPKFEYDAEASLADTLKQMGMPVPFDPDEANFSGMDGTRRLFISDVFHKAYVAVDEEGTEAAAATAVIVATESMPMTDVELVVNRPFLYLIRDTQTGAPLFLGRVLDPSQ